MKQLQKFLFLLCIAVIVFFSYNESVIASSKTVTVTYNGQKIVFPDAQPFIDKANRIQVPIRYIGNALNVKVDYATRGQAKTAVFSNATTKVEFVLNTSTYYVNNKKYEMDTKSQVLHNRTYTPARYLAEQFGAAVNWNAKTQTVEIVQKSQVEDTATVVNKSGQFIYTNDSEALAQYKSTAIILLKNNATYMQNNAVGISQFESLASQMIMNSENLASSVAAYKLKSTATDYRWTNEDVTSFAAELDRLNNKTILKSEVFHSGSEKILSYRYIVYVNNVPIWLEVQFTFKQISGQEYQLIKIKA